MNKYNDLTNEDFREIVTDFIAANCPDHLRFNPKKIRRSQAQSWMNCLAEKGWLAPSWPQEYGGMGLNIEKQLIYQSVFDVEGISRFPDQAIAMLGPILIRYGSKEQKKKFLPEIVSARHVWCQGYSEPSAGSDLAALRTRAELKGNNFIVTGQKTWTTLAQDADWMFMLVRTMQTVRKQEGISFILLNMKSPGVTIRPIQTLSGEAEFCEVFFDNVIVPIENLVGELHQGWNIAKALLGFERLMLSSPRYCNASFDILMKIAHATGALKSNYWKLEISKIEIELLTMTEMYIGFCDEYRNNGLVPEAVSIGKILSTELNQKINEKIIELHPENALLQEINEYGDCEIDILSYYWQSKPATIYGGANEIQKNILAKNLIKFLD